MVGLNFSSATTPELLLKTFDHYCEYRRTPNGVVMSPIQLGKWVVLFCDEINLPDTDKYGEWEEGDGYLLVLLEKSLMYSCELVFSSAEYIVVGNCQEYTGIAESSPKL